VPHDMGALPILSHASAPCGDEAMGGKAWKAWGLCPACACVRPGTREHHMAKSAVRLLPHRKWHADSASMIGCEGSGLLGQRVKQGDDAGERESAVDGDAELMAGN
jgi:hypothetical protein